MEHAQWCEKPVTPPPPHIQLWRYEMNFVLANITFCPGFLKVPLISTIYNSLYLYIYIYRSNKGRLFCADDYISEASPTVYLKSGIFCPPELNICAFWCHGKIKKLLTVDTATMRICKAEEREGKSLQQRMDRKRAVILRGSVCTCFMRISAGRRSCGQ